MSICVCVHQTNIDSTRAFWTRYISQETYTRRLIDSFLFFTQFVCVEKPSVRFLLQLSTQAIKEQINTEELLVSNKHHKPNSKLKNIIWKSGEVMTKAIWFARYIRARWKIVISSSDSASLNVWNNIFLRFVYIGWKWIIGKQLLVARLYCGRWLVHL